jgi:hypothetical protein
MEVNGLSLSECNGILEKIGYKAGEELGCDLNVT